MVKGIHHIAIRSENVENIINFYTEVLDYTFRKKWSFTQINHKQPVIVKSADGNTFIEIFDKGADIAAQVKKRSGEEEIIQGALLHLALNLKDAKKVFKKAIEYGSKPYIEPFET